MNEKRPEPRKTCANCSKWTVVDSSDVAEYRGTLIENVTEATPVELVLGFFSPETTLLMSQGRRECTFGLICYGTSDCYVPGEFTPRKK